MFAIELEARMKALGLTGNQLATGLGMKPTRISEMLTNKRNIYPFVAQSLTELEAEMTNTVELLFEQVVEQAGLGEQDPDTDDLVRALAGRRVKLTPHFDRAGTSEDLGVIEAAIYTRFQRNLALTACGRIYAELSQLGIECEIVPGLESEGWVEVEEIG